MDVSLGIVQKDDKYLLIKRVKEVDGLTWAFPGGKRESIDNTIVDTAIREVLDETGIIFQPVHLIDSKKMSFGYLHYIYGKYVSGVPHSRRGEVLDCGFYTPKEIEEKITTPLHPLVRELLYR